MWEGRFAPIPVSLDRGEDAAPTEGRKKASERISE
jgi:hypothetical protein